MYKKCLRTNSRINSSAFSFRYFYPWWKVYREPVFRCASSTTCTMSYTVYFINSFKIFYREALKFISIIRSVLFDFQIKHIRVPFLPFRIKNICHSSSLNSSSLEFKRRRRRNVRKIETYFHHINTSKMTDSEKYFRSERRRWKDHVTKVSISLNVYFIRNFYRCQRNSPFFQASDLPRSFPVAHTRAMKHSHIEKIACILCWHLNAKPEGATRRMGFSSGGRVSSRILAT